jgi:hypothetical protein
MRTTVLAKRYLPLATAIGVLLLVIAAFPAVGRGSTVATGSTGPIRGFSVGSGSASPTGTAVTAAGGGAGPVQGSVGDASVAAGSGGGGGSEAGAGTAGTAGTGGPSASGSPSGGDGVAAGSAVAGGTAAAKPAANATALSGDTTHCVAGREFSPTIDYYAPPCTPGTPGAALASNGGATSAGVTSNQIEIVDFVTDYGAVVNAILQAEGAYETEANAQQLMAAYQNFVNSKYVLWGRKIHIDVYQSTCTAAPPDLQCLLPEMDSITATYHPFAVMWVTTVCSACFAELAKDGVVGIGGAGFPDSFSNQLAPYFYSAGESATRMATEFAQFWCNELSSVSSPSRKVAFAGTENPAQNFNGQPRDLGVVTENDPEDEDVVTQVLQPELTKLCNDGASINAHHYYYDEDASTAAEQTQAGIEAMNTPTDPATSVLCLCDVVAPAFSYGGSKEENYWPEPIIADTQGMGVDAVGQSFESGTACASPPCEFDNAFGLTAYGHEQAPPADPGYAAYDAGGGAGSPVSGALADAIWENLNMLASLIENTGPDLTPSRMQAAAPSMGTRGGGTTGYAELGFAPGDYQWTQDSSIVYFDKNATSSYNGKAGAYVQVGDSRYGEGQFPVLSGNPAIPTGR